MKNNTPEHLRWAERVFFSSYGFLISMLWVIPVGMYYNVPWFVFKFSIPLLLLWAGVSALGIGMGIRSNGKYAEETERLIQARQ